MTPFKPGDILQCIETDGQWRDGALLEEFPVVYRNTSDRGSTNVGTRLDGWSPSRFKLIQRNMTDDKPF
jgi:hypothetical protein